MQHQVDHYWSTCVKCRGEVQSFQVEQQVFLLAFRKLLACLNSAMRLHTRNGSSYTRLLTSSLKP